MPTLDETITGFVTGDNLEIRRAITELPAEIATAWLTVKRYARQADDEALFQKEITIVDDPGVGQIVDPGGGGDDGDLRFDFTSTDTTALGSAAWVYDIQLVLTTGVVYTPEKGTIALTADVTRSTS